MPRKTRPALRKFILDPPMATCIRLRKAIHLTMNTLEFPVPLRTPFMDAQQPRQKKRFRRFTYLIDATETPPLDFLPEFSYGSPYIPAATEQSVQPGDINTGGGYWGDAVWGEFFWDGQVFGEADAYIDGQGINMSLFISGQSNYERRHTLQAATIYYTPRGLRR